MLSWICNGLFCFRCLLIGLVIIVFATPLQIALRDEHTKRHAVLRASGLSSKISTKQLATRVAAKVANTRAKAKAAEGAEQGMESNVKPGGIKRRHDEASTLAEDQKLRTRVAVKKQKLQA